MEPEFMSDALDDLAADNAARDADGYLPVDPALEVEYDYRSRVVEDIPFCTGVQTVIACNLSMHALLEMLRVPAGHAGCLPIPGVDAKAVK